MLVGRAGGHDRQGAYLEPTQVVDRGEVEAGRLQSDHGHVGLAGRGRREQVGYVDAAAEHDDSGFALEQTERSGLPGRPRGEDQHDDHADPLSPGGPR